MITPRRIRLLRARDLAGYRDILASVARELDPRRARDAFVLVPTTAAAEQLSRTLEGRLGESHALPHLGPRDDLYHLLIERLPSRPQALTPFERETLLSAAAHEAEESGTPPPFHLRPALVAEMLALYDHIRRVGRTVDDFDRLMTGELEPAAESDRGAAQLLEQTQFLSAAYRIYESRLIESQRYDEHAMRARVIDMASAEPLTHLVIAVGDQPFDTNGVWPADVTLFASIPGLERIDIVSTDTVLEAGYEDRLRLAFVELEDERHAVESRVPVLVVPDNGTAFSYRDREDELEAVARRLAIESPPDLGRVGLVVARPLPYLYLAREVFGGADVPFEALDTLPLAAEPYAAAMDLVLECAAANFTRRALTALLRSPHFTFIVDGTAIDRQAVGALDAALAEQRYLGGVDRLRSIAASGDIAGPAITAALDVADALSPLVEQRPLIDQVAVLRAFLDAHDRPHDDRRRRVRAAVMTTLDELAESHRRHDPAAAGTVTELSAAIRRWLGAQTFALGTRTSGVRILDAPSARFADLDEVQILGLVEGEWPERARRNVFYPRSLIAPLEPSRPERIALDEERDHVRASRAMFRDLVGLAKARTRVSTFALESESVVEPSTFIEDLATFDLPTQTVQESREPVLTYERLARDPLAGGTKWAAIRAAGAARDRRRFEGEAGPWTLPRVSVSRLERYMKCPFQFFVSNVLQVTEEPEDESSRSPLARGRFLHELFETFFHEWQARGRGRITAAAMHEARALFAEIAEPALRSLPPAEAELERARLFGSAVGSGIADRVFAMEAERGVDIRERLMEYELDGVFRFTGEDGSARDVRLRAKIDRVDLLADSTFRLIDYKTKYVPDRRQALQLPIYSACVQTSLAATHGRNLPPGEAMYLSFEGPQPIVTLDERGKSIRELIAAAEQRLVAALDDIAAGHYPARPETKNLCTMCAFTAVCRHPGGVESADEADA